MPIHIIIPGSLKDWFNGKTEISCDGNTIQECLENINHQYPGFKNRIFNITGDLPKVLVFLNGDNIKYLDGLETVTKDSDEVSIIPLAAGG